MRLLGAAIVATGLLLSGLAEVGVNGESGAVVRATAHAPVRSAGCRAHQAAPPPAGGLQTMTVNGSSYHYRLALPAHPGRGRALPMIVEFQGYGSTALGMATLTQLPDRGARRGFVVVTPEGPGHTWQLSGRGSDARYVEAVMARVQASVCVDLGRVYAAGFSQGAAFTILLSCAHPRQMAAIATVAVEFRLGCATPQPLLAFHGTSDPAVPYENGAMGLSLPGVKVRGTLLNMGDWAQLDRCRSVPTLRRLGSDVQRTVWPSCAGGAEVILYTVLGGGHTWPGALRSASPMYTTETISATNLALSFFARHRREPTGSRPG